MYSDEETELRDLIMQNLESCGFLNNIKAELRAGVFLALEKDGNLKNKVPLFNQKIDDFINTSEGKLIISLIREFLDYFNLKFTLSVFDPEAGSSVPIISRSELCAHLNLKNSDVDGPVIVALLKNIIGSRNEGSSNKSSDNHNSVLEKSVKSTSNENTSEKGLEDLFNRENSDHDKEIPFLSSFKKDYAMKSSKDNFNALGSFSEVDNENKDVTDKVNSGLGDIFKEKSDETKKFDDNNLFKKPNNNILSPDHDPFFDEPLPPEKPSFLAFDSSKEKSESKFSPSTRRDFDDSKKNSLTSLKDLPSLTAGNEWTFTRDPKSALQSLDSLKSISSSETSNEEIINLDSKEVFEKKDSDIAESNEESSEKQNSEESIEEEIDESSAGLDDLLASSLSLADDVTTDQTISQVSVVEGIDHVEPCK